MYGSYDDFSDNDEDGISTNMIMIMVIAIVVSVWWFFLTKKSSKHTGPPDIQQLGRASWTLLHTMASKFSPHDDKTRREMNQFLYLFAKFYPCEECSTHMEGYLQRNPPNVSSRQDLQMWCCRLHNDVNRKLGKPLWDCEDGGKIDSRWNNSGQCFSCKPKWTG